MGALLSHCISPPLTLGTQSIFPLIAHLPSSGGWDTFTLSSRTISAVRVPSYPLEMFPPWRRIPPDRLWFPRLQLQANVHSHLSPDCWKRGGWSRKWSRRPEELSEEYPNSDCAQGSGSQVSLRATCKSTSSPALSLQFHHYNRLSPPALHRVWKSIWRKFHPDPDKRDDHHQVSGCAPELQSTLAGWDSAHGVILKTQQAKPWADCGSRLKSRVWDSQGIQEACLKYQEHPATSCLVLAFSGPK